MRDVIINDKFKTKPASTVGPVLFISSINIMWYETKF